MQVIVITNRNYSNQIKTLTDLQKGEIKKSYETKIKDINGFVIKLLHGLIFRPCLLFMHKPQEHFLVLFL